MSNKIVIGISVVIVVSYVYVFVVLSVVNTYTINARPMYVFRFAKAVVNHFSWILIVFSEVLMSVKVYHIMVDLKRPKSTIYLIHSSLITLLLLILVTLPIGYQLIRPSILFLNVFWISFVIELCETLTAVIYLASALLLHTLLMSLCFSVYKFKVVIKPKARPQPVMRPMARPVMPPVMGPMGPMARPVLIQRGGTPVIIHPKQNLSYDRRYKNTKIVTTNRNNPQIVIMKA